MERRLVSVLGTTAKHILHGLQRALRAVALTGLIVALIVAVLTEAVGAYLAQSFPPPGPVHLAAAALALSFGYAAAMTVFVEELLRAIIKAVELIVEEAERLERAAVHEAEALARRAEEAGIQVGQTALRDAGSLERGVAGAIGAVVGGLGREAGSIEHNVAAHVPGRHAENPATDTTPSSSR